MLAELAAANAAFAIIKKTIANGRELASAGKAISDFVNAEEKLKNKGNKKKNSFWRKVGGNEGSDLEEFMALEQIKQKKAELETAMIYYGRAGLHGDWVRFQADARKRRQREAEERKKRKQQTIEFIIITALVLLGASLAIYFLWIFSLAVRG